MNRNVIFDVGLHKGEDTAYYLARGYKVVAVEADPKLIEYCQRHFSDYVASGALTIIHGAITSASNGTVTFFRNAEVSVWGTTVASWANRNARLGAPYSEIEVPVVDLNEVFEEFGCPYYMKIDIEGMDVECLRKLKQISSRPKWISLESEKVSFELLRTEFDLLEALGYHKFLIQQQGDIYKRIVPCDTKEGPYVKYLFRPGSSGPFGTDLGDQWLSRAGAEEKYREIFKQYRLFGDSSLMRGLPGGKALLHALSKIARRPLPGWYDTHAMLK